MMRDRLHKHRELCILFLALLLALAIFLDPNAIRGDGLGYYIYARSLFFDFDLFFLNEAQIADIVNHCYVTPTDCVGNVFAPGASLFWLPFLLAGHTLTYVLTFVGYDFLADGFSAPYHLAIHLGTCLWGAGALLLTWQVARQLFTRGIALAAVLLVWFFTPLFWYMFLEPSWPHAVAAFCVSLFLYLWYETRTDRTTLQWCVLGLVCGLGAQVRPENGVIILLPVTETLRELAGRQCTWARARHWLCFTMAAALALLPQALVWAILSDSPISVPFYETDYLSVGETCLKWGSPAIVESLFSPYHGLYFWSPILLMATVGLFGLYRKDGRLAVALLLVFLAELYVNGLLYDWWAGLAFGARRFVDITPVFVLGLAAALEKMNRKLLYPLIIAAAGWTILLMFQAAADKAYSTFYIPTAQLLEGQLWTVKHLPQLAGSGLLTARCETRLLLLLFLPMAIASFLFLRALPLARLAMRKGGGWPLFAVLALVAVSETAVVLASWPHTSRHIRESTDELRAYAGREATTKARFLYGPTYLEHVSYYLAIGELELARETFLKAHRLYRDRADPTGYYDSFRSLYGPRLQRLGIHDL